MIATVPQKIVTVMHHVMSVELIGVIVLYGQCLMTPPLKLCLVFVKAVRKDHLFYRSVEIHQKTPVTTKLVKCAERNVNVH